MTITRRSAMLAGTASLLPGPAAAAPVQDFLDRLVKRQELPGAILRVSGARGTHEAVAGFADLRSREAVTPRTRFYIASCGKLATAAVVLQMVEEGRVRLQDPVFPALPEVKGLRSLRNIQRVTVEQLLKHRSGLAEYYTDDFETAAAAQPRKVFGAAESLAFAYGQPAQSRPGAEHNYTNTNFVLLGLLIEALDKSGYAQSLRRRIFEPLGMQSTTVGAKAGEPALARGYSRGRRGRRDEVSYGGWNAVTGDGALVTTAADYEKFIVALMRQGKLLPPRAAQRMCKAQAEEPDSGYGLGCTVDDTPWGEAWGHNGTITGFNADTWYLPRHGASVVFFANGDFRDDEVEVVEPAVRAYLKA